MSSGTITTVAVAVPVSRARAEVSRLLSTAQSELDKGLPVPDGRILLEAYLWHWLESIAPTIRPRTHTSYEYHIRLHIAPSLGSTPLSKLQPAQVQAFVNRLHERGLAPSTVQRIRATLRCALNQALRWGLVQRNVATLVDMPKARRPRFDPMTLAEAQQLLAVAKGHPIEPIIVVALATGLRQGEILGLRWQDIDPHTGTLTVRHALQRIDGQMRLVRPKTQLSQRRLPLTQRVLHMLRQLHANRPQQPTEEPWHADLVFPSPSGRPRGGVNVTRTYQRLLAKAGLPRRRFHDLRHACATFLLAEGVELQVVKETLGHSQISLTADTYAHVMPSLKRDAADRLGQALWGSGWGQDWNEPSDTDPNPPSS